MLNWNKENWVLYNFFISFTQCCIQFSLTFVKRETKVREQK